MDDIKIILYILAAVAYFLFTQWRKAFQSPEEQEKQVPEQQKRRAPSRQPARPATSFEDILRELQPKLDRGKDVVIETVTEKKEELMPPLVAATAKPKYRNYEEDIPKVLSWEKAAEARDLQKQFKLRSKSPFTAYAQEEAPTSKYAKMLRNPATVRDAVILSEIFNRKYN